MFYVRQRFAAYDRHLSEQSQLLKHLVSNIQTTLLPSNELATSSAIKAAQKFHDEKIVVSDDEVDDEAYGNSLQQSFGDRVKVIPVHEKAGEISAPHVRNVLASGDFEEFAEAVPEAAYNKGFAPKIFKMLGTKVKGNAPEQA